jgi:acyl-coenzyme A synthetase/AMP-(fatty) acid ligase
MQHSDTFVTRTSRQSLRLLGTVGEPINPEAWRWYNTIVGHGRCPIMDTWWQVSFSIDDYRLICYIYPRLKQVVFC